VLGNRPACGTRPEEGRISLRLMRLLAPLP
jgi:hypothetical protein